MRYVLQRQVQHRVDSQRGEDHDAAGDGRRPPDVRGHRRPADAAGGAVVAASLREGDAQGDQQ